MLKVLTINLCATWKTSRAKRLAQVAEFVRQEGVDILLVQEGARSCWFYSVVRKLAKATGLEYFAKSAFGWPVFWEFQVGVLSKLKFIGWESLNCEVPQQEWIDAVPLPWRSRVVAARLQAPFEQIMAVSVHLSSSPKTPADRERQVRVLLAWLSEVSAPVILGGDFNMAADDPCFKMILGAGFGVVGASAPDFIFLRGPWTSIAQKVFMDHVVSDHSGIMATVRGVYA